MTSAEHALVSFCKAEHPRLVGVLSLYCGDRSVAEELAQEAVLRVCRDWSRVRELDDPVAWLNRVAFNLAKSGFRHRAAERKALLRMTARGRAPDDRDDAAAVAVRRAVARLPERQKHALLLRYFLDLSVADTAEQLGCPEGTVKTLTFQAIAALRQAGLEFDDG